jgi:hypothetical protein
MNAHVTNLFNSLRDLVSTYRHPAYVATVDALIAGMACVSLQLAMVWTANHVKLDGYTYTIDATSVIVLGGMTALLAAVSGGTGSQLARTRMYLVRSTRSSLLWTLTMLLIPATLIWGCAAIFFNTPDLWSWASMVSIFGFGLANIGYRILGFVDPYNIAAQLRAGHRDEANAVIAASWAVKGATFVPDDNS